MRLALSFLRPNVNEIIKNIKLKFLIESILVINM